MINRCSDHAANELTYLAWMPTASAVMAFGPDKVTNDVAASGPGMGSLQDGKPNAPRIRSLVAQGARFDAYMNPRDDRANTRKPCPLLTDTRDVEAGAVRIMTLAEHGYTTVRL